MPATAEFGLDDPDVESFGDSDPVVEQSWGLNDPPAPTPREKIRAALSRDLEQARAEGEIAQRYVKGWESLEYLAKEPVAHLPRSTSAEIQQAIPGTPKLAADVIAGAQQGVADVTESALTLPNLALMGASGVAGKAVAGAFGALMAKELPGQASAIGTAIGEGRTEEAVRIGLGTAAGAVLVPALARHALSKTAPKTAAAIEGERPLAPAGELAPLTAEAVQELPPVIKETPAPIPEPVGLKPAPTMDEVLIAGHDSAGIKAQGLTTLTASERDIVQGKLYDWVREEAEKYEATNGNLEGFSIATVVNSRLPTALEYLGAQKRGGGAETIALDKPAGEGDAVVSDIVPSEAPGPATATATSELRGKVDEAVSLLEPKDQQTVREFLASGKGNITKALAAKLVPLLEERGITAEDMQPMVGMGGAIPEEFALRAQSPTSIKNAKVDAERVKRGLPPAVQPARRTFGEVWDQAIKKIDDDPAYQDRLINDLREKPRALTDLEDATLLQRQIDLQNEYNKATRDLAQAVDDGRAEDIPNEQARVAQLSDQLLDLYNIGKKVGTETGRGLAARKMMVNEDFSLAALELRKRQARNFEPLTEAERAELQKLANDFQTKNAALEKLLADKDERIATIEAQQALAKIQAEAAKTTASPYVISVAEKIVAGLEKRADAARVRLREKMGRTSVGVDPTILADLAEIGASHIGRVGLDFARWSIEMAKDVGEWVKPHLEDVFKASQKLVDNVTQTPGVRRVVKKEGASEQAFAVERIKAKVQAGEANITSDVQKLVRSFVEQGINNRDALVDAVHAVLKEADPEITRLEAIHAISGYGKYKLLTKDEISVQVRDLKGQLQQVSKLEDMQAGEAPKKTGVERRTPSDEERRLIKQVEEAKKKGGYTVTDPATQLRSALQATQRRLENQIADLEHEIATQSRIVKAKTKGPTSPEVEALRGKRDALKAERDQILKDIQENDPLYQAEVEAHKLNAQRDALLKSIAKKEKQLLEGDIAAQSRPVNRPSDPVIEPLRQERDALNKELAEARKKPAEQKAAEALARRLKELNKAIAAREAKLAAGDLSANSPAQQVNRPLLPELEEAKQKLEAVNAKIAEARKAARPTKSPEEIALRAMKTRMANLINELDRKLAKGDFSTKPKREIQLDTEATRLKFELEQIKRKYAIGLERDRLAQRTALQKAFEGTFKTARLMRDIMTSGEFSVILKQGAFGMFSRPIRTSKAIADLFRSFASEKGDFAVNEKIKARENYQAYQRSGLHLYEIGDKLSKMDEAVMSEWAARIPVLKAFQRSFSTFLNVVRADAFDALESTVARGRKLTPFEGKLAANFINANTGRGSLAARETVLVGLNTWFFAPRYWLSRLQVLSLQPVWHQVSAKESAPAMRKAIAMEYARALIGIGTVMTLAKMGGATVDTDPKSTNYRKIVLPSGTTIDLFAGLLQNTVFFSRIAAGEKTTQRGRTVPIRRTTEKRLPYGTSDAAGVTGQFLRTKLAPIPATGLDLASGSDVMGNLVTPASAAANLVTPMTWGDIYQIMKLEGIPSDLALALLSMAGGGVRAPVER